MRRGPALALALIAGAAQAGSPARPSASKTALVRALAALERVALRPPQAALTDAPTIADAVHTRLLLEGAVPLLAGRIAQERRARALSGLHPADLRASQRQAEARAVLLARLPRLSPASPGATGVVYRLPLAGALLAGMGEPLADGGRTTGLTLATATHASVAAPAGGRAAYVGAFGGYGTVVILDHGHGWTTLLAGLGRSDVAESAAVAAGQPLGRMPAASPRLTIELRHHGRPVDVAAMAAWRGG